MTTNINITQTWWRLLSAVGSTLITLVAWLGYMALCMVGEVILGIVKFIFGIIISILSILNFRLICSDNASCKANYL